MALTGVGEGVTMGVMVQGIDAAIDELLQHPDSAVVAEVRGVLVEVRLKPRTADDVFREIGPWEGESAEELMRLLREARAAGGSKEPVEF